MAKRKKKEEEQSGPMDPEAAEFLAGEQEEANLVEVLTPEEYQLNRVGRIWSYDDTGQLLTVEQSLFCRSYVIDRNPIAALRRLNYGGTPNELRKLAERYMAEPEVQACIAELAGRMMKRLEITADQVNARLAAVAFFDPRNVMEFDHHGLRLKHSRFWTKDEAYAIAGVESGQYGIKLKMHDGVRAAEILGKQIGTLKDDSEEARAATTKANAELVIGTIVDIFRKTRDQRIAALPPPTPPATP